MFDRDAALLDALDDDARWRALLTRDVRFDGRFLYGVMTTGVYCRPSCASRKPLRRNVRFFDRAEDAQAAGLRPCKRCRPGAAASLHGGRVAAACRLIEEAEEEPSLEALAAHAGLSPFHFHRVFKAALGVTPKAYAKARREARLRARLAEATSVTAAIYEAGYAAPSRFYEGAKDALGMAPAARKAKGAGERIRFALGRSSLGEVLVAASETGVCAIMLGDDPAVMIEDFQKDFANAELIGGDPEFEDLVARVVGFLEKPGNGAAADLPLDIRGTVFQRKVWEALRRIPPGRTATYAEIAAAVGSPAAVRAVGSACGANRLAVVIPCHRVVRADGGLSGYRWGVERKRALLRREAADR